MARPPGHGPGFEARRQAIIDEAAVLFARRGYAATGIAEIGSAVALGRGALYNYIGSKEQLLVEIQDRVLSPLLVAAGTIDGLPESPLVKLRLLSGSLLSIIFQRLDHIWVYEHDYRYLTGENHAKVVAQRHAFEAIVRNLIQAAIDLGDFTSSDAQLSMLQFLNLHNYTYQWARPSGSREAADLARTYCATLFRGFGSSASLEVIEERAAELLSDPELSSVLIFH